MVGTDSIFTRPLCNASFDRPHGTLPSWARPAAVSSPPTKKHSDDPASNKAFDHANLWSAADIDGDGSLSLDEFLEALPPNVRKQRSPPDV